MERSYHVKIAGKASPLYSVNKYDHAVRLAKEGAERGGSVTVTHMGLTVWDSVSASNNMASPERSGG